MDNPYNIDEATDAMTVRESMHKHNSAVVSGRITHGDMSRESISNRKGSGSNSR